MRRILMLSAVLAASVTYAVPAASACPVTEDPSCWGSEPYIAKFDVTAGSGVVCQLSTVSDVTIPGSIQTGQISGGPLVTLYLDTLNPGAGPRSGTLSCYVQVDNATPTGPVGNPGVSGHGTGVVTAGPGQFSFTATVTQSVYLCSQWTEDGGPTYYYDDATSSFTTSAVPCSLTGSLSTPGASAPVDGL
jgi:hypothetical protein